MSDVKELTDEQLDKVTGGNHVYESNYGTFMVPDNLEDKLECDVSIVVILGV